MQLNSAATLLHHWSAAWGSQLLSELDALSAVDAKPDAQGSACLFDGAPGFADSSEEATVSTRDSCLDSESQAKVSTSGDSDSEYL